MNINKLSFVKKSVMVIAFSTLLVVSQGASALGYDKSHKTGGSVTQEMSKSNNGHHMKRKMKKLAKYLALSEEQKLALRNIMTEQKAERISRKESMLGFRKEMNALSLDSVFNEVQFQLIYDKYHDDFEQRALNKAKTRHAMMQILTEEQREKFSQMKEKKQKRSKLF